MKNLYNKKGKLNKVIFVLTGVFTFFSISYQAQTSYTSDVSNGCSPLTVTFTNTSTVGEAYYWNYDDGNGFNGIDEAYTFNNPGEYLVRLNAYDTTGGIWNFAGETQSTITVYGLNWGGPSMMTACPGEEIHYYYDGIGTGVKWLFGDGDTSLLENPKHIYTLPGTYNVSCILTHPCGSDTVIQSIVVSPSSIPYSNFTMDRDTVCPNDNIYFRYNGTHIASNSYSWNFGDGSPLGLNNWENHAYPNTGSFYPSLTVMNLCGNSSTTTDTVTISTTVFFGNIGLFAETGCPGDPIGLNIWGNQSEPTFLSYAWNFGDGNVDSSSTRPTHVYASIGSYNVSVTVTNGCGADTTLTTVAVIGNNISPVLNPQDYGVATEGEASCPGDSVLFYYGGTGVGIAWDFGDGNSATATEEIYIEEQGSGMWVTVIKHAYLTSGSYTATLTVTNGCGLSSSNTALVTIGSSAPAVADFVWEAPLNGPLYYACEPVSFIAIGGLVYEWDFGDGFTDSTNVTNVYHAYALPGIYSVQMTVTNGCGNTDVLTQTITIDEMGGSSIQTNVSCFGGSDGTMDVSIVGGVAPYTFLWNNGATTEDLTGLPTGSYIATVTDANGCSISGGDVITEPTAITLTMGMIKPTCLNSDGSAGVVPSGGTAPYTYSWSPVPSTNDTLTGISAGFYTVAVTDANGCQTSKSINVTDAGAPILTVDLVTPNDCNGNAIGSINITTTGGTPSYTYIWSNGASTEDVSGLIAGTYDLTVFDMNGCITSITETITEPAPMILSTVTTDITCNAVMDGSIDLIVSGGTSGYTYSWDNGATTEDLLGLGSGSYYATVIDANGCVAGISTTINEPNAISVTTSLVSSTCGNANGIAGINVTGGTPGYTYLWSTGETNDTLSNVVAGTYTVTTTDANSCQQSSSITITDAPLHTLSTLATDIACNSDATGTINLTVSGGTAPFVYNWSDVGVLTEDRTGLLAGSYNVMVTDANGCTVSTTIVLSEPTALIVSGIVTNVNCNGGSDGSITTSISGGTFGYTYLWSNGATTQNIVNDVAGAYNLTVTDANGCVAMLNETISEPSIMVLTTVATAVTCNSGTDGSVNLTVSGGTPGYSYLWDNNAITEDLTGLIAGTYNVTVTDANGCFDVTGSVVNEPTALSIIPGFIQSTCGNTDGAAGITVTGGTPGYAYSWSTGGVNDTITNIGAGNYIVTITDANSCVEATVISVSDIGGQTLSFSVTDLSCNGDATGAIDLTVTGGTPSYTFVWSNASTTEDLTGLAAGNYNIVVTDANNCQASLNIAVAEPSVITASNTVVDASCNGDTDGSIDLTVTGGTPIYTFLWSNTSTTEDLTGLVAGNYNVTITDANGCIIMNNGITVNEPTPVTAPSVTQVGDSLMSSSAATYQWNTSGTPINGETNQYLSPSVNGYYTVSISDINGCAAISDSVLFQFTGVKEIFSATITEVYPIPVSDLLFVKLMNNSSKDVWIEINNSMGQMVKKVLCSERGNYVKTIDFSSLSHGVYYLTIRNEQIQMTKKVIK